MNRSGTIQLLIRWAIAGVFLYAAFPKIADPAGFARSIANYQILPDAAINPLAIFLPWLELVCAVSLIAIPALRRGALILTGGMLLVFVVAIISALARGLNIECGCFSTSGQGGKAALPQLLLDLALIAGVVSIWRAESRKDRHA